MPVHDDRVLFEFLILEVAQAGLSWATILKKRENYREAFDQFDAAAVALYDMDKQAAIRNPVSTSSSRQRNIHRARHQH